MWFTKFSVCEKIAFNEFNYDTILHGQGFITIVSTHWQPDIYTVNVKNVTFYF